jgi:hypothetical protein
MYVGLMHTNTGARKPVRRLYSVFTWTRPLRNPSSPALRVHFMKHSTLTTLDSYPNITYK